MSIKVSIKGTQAVEAALKKALSAYKEAPSVTVGIHEAAGMHPDATMTNAKLGALLNYGNPKIPPRPWLIPGFKSGETRYAKDLKNTIEGGGTVEMAMVRVGTLAKGNIQRFMTDLKTPPNAPLTIALKGSDNPLIDTGELRASVDFILQRGIPMEGGLS